MTVPRHHRQRELHSARSAAEVSTSVGRWKCLSHSRRHTSRFSRSSRRCCRGGASPSAATSPALDPKSPFSCRWPSSSSSDDSSLLDDGGKVGMLGCTSELMWFTAAASSAAASAVCARHDPRPRPPDAPRETLPLRPRLPRPLLPPRPPPPLPCFPRPIAFSGAATVAGSLSRGLKPAAAKKHSLRMIYPVAREAVRWSGGPPPTCEPEHKTE